jgi:hypothetical protein
MDCPRAEMYEPLRVLQPLLSALTAIHAPTDVVSFVQQFGLLHGPAPDSRDLPVTARDGLTWYTTTAREIREIVQLHRQVTRATQGDTDARTFLRHWATETFPQMDDGSTFTPASESQNLPAMALTASRWIAGTLTNNLFKAKPLIYDRAAIGEAVKPGLLRIGIAPQSLMDVCYLAIALALAEKEPLALCPECQRVFVVEDARQKFCTPACGGRARLRRFTTNRTAKTTTRKRTRRGKATTR